MIQENILSQPSAFAIGHPRHRHSITCPSSHMGHIGGTQVGPFQRVISRTCYSAATNCWAKPLSVPKSPSIGHHHTTTVQGLSSLCSRCGPDNANRPTLLVLFLVLLVHYCGIHFGELCHAAGQHGRPRHPRVYATVGTVAGPHRSTGS